MYIYILYSRTTGKRCVINGVVNHVTHTHWIRGANQHGIILRRHPGKLAC